MTTNLRQQRQDLSLTASRVAAQLGVHPNSVHRWERRDRLPGPGHIHQLARSLGLSTPEVADFFQVARTPWPGGHDAVRGHGLRPLRNAAGISVRQIADRVGVLPATVYNWESGRARIPAGQLPRLAELLRLDIGVLEELLRQAPAIAGPSHRHSDTALRRMRRRCGLSQARVAERIGVSRHTVGGWERGQRPPLHAVRRLAQVYGVPVAVVASAAGVAPPRLLDDRTWRSGDLPAVLRTLREWSGVSRRDVALRCGCSVDAVRSWESGRGTPRALMLGRLEALYRLGPGALLRACPERG